MVRRPLAAALTAALLGSGLFLAAAPVAEAAPTSHSAATFTAKAAAPKPRAYANCTALNKVYKHGVARAGARDKVTGKAKPVKTFTVDTKTYNLNKKSDRDKDGIACEKK